MIYIGDLIVGEPMSSGICLKYSQTKYVCMGGHRDSKKVKKRKCSVPGDSIVVETSGHNVRVGCMNIVWFSGYS